jgi:hypothetical protein
VPVVNSWESKNDTDILNSATISTSSIGNDAHRNADQHTCEHCNLYTPSSFISCLHYYFFETYRSIVRLEAIHTHLRNNESFVLLLP